MITRRRFERTRRHQSYKTDQSRTEFLGGWSRYARNFLKRTESFRIVCVYIYIHTHTHTHIYDSVRVSTKVKRKKKKNDETSCDLTVKKHLMEKVPRYFVVGIRES